MNFCLLGPKGLDMYPAHKYSIYKICIVYIYKIYLGYTNMQGGAKVIYSCSYGK